MTTPKPPPSIESVASCARAAARAIDGHLKYHTGRLDPRSRDQGRDLLDLKRRAEVLDDGIREIRLSELHEIYAALRILGLDLQEQTAEDLAENWQGSDALRSAVLGEIRQRVDSLDAAVGNIAGERLSALDRAITDQASGLAMTEHELLGPIRRQLAEIVAVLRILGMDLQKSTPADLRNHWRGSDALRRAVLGEG